MWILVQKIKFCLLSLMPGKLSRKNPVLIVQTETDMRVTLAEVARGLIDEPYTVRLFLGSNQTWEIELLTKSGRVHQIQTRRGPTRTWLALERAIEAVRGHCRAAESILVELDGLELRWEQK